MDKKPIVFSNDGIDFVGWLARPANASANTPLIVLTHGLSGIVDLDLERYAEKFSGAGFACLAYDHRNWGRSGGWPRGETDPWKQVNDLRAAISFGAAQSGIDSARIGLWGTSYAGGHVLTVSALDRRVKCAVSQVPLISGSRTFNAWVPSNRQEKFLERMADDWQARGRGEEPKTTKAATPGSETEEWIVANNVKGTYRNELTIRTFDLLRTYEPISFVERISPTPLLMVIASNDTQTPTAWQREAFELMGEPKRMLEIDCRHYDVYMDRLDEAADGACEWYTEHL